MRRCEDLIEAVGDGRSSQFERRAAEGSFSPRPCLPLINTVFAMRNFSLGNPLSLRIGLGLSAWVLAAAIGCEKPGNSDPAFLLNTQGMDQDEFKVLSTDNEEATKAKKEIKIPGREYVASALEAMFGTPDRPFVFRESGLDLNKIRKASGPYRGLPASVRQQEEESLRKSRDDIRAGLKELESKAKTAAAEAAPHEAKVKELQPQLDAAKKAKDAPRIAELEQQVKEQQPKIIAKNEADGNLAADKATEADLTAQIDSYNTPQAGLYRQHCVHCHGVNGDGAGPTALFLFPYPRDYRQGKFKFKSTAKGQKPTRDDLTRILVHGIPDTAMPSFSMLKPDEIDALVEYVKYLAIRGEAEQRLNEATASDKLEPKRSVLLEVALSGAVESWKDAEQAVVGPKAAYAEPASRAEWLKAGASLFVSEKAKCSTCHGNTGLGDGRNSKPFYDDWNKPKFEAEEALNGAVAALEAAKPEEQAAAKLIVTSKRNIANSWLLPLQQQYPRNLRLNRFRFGRTPLDVYRRINAGIEGTEMPGFGTALTDTEIWQLVDYVLTLPYYHDGLSPYDPGYTQTHPPKGESHASHGTEAASPTDPARAHATGTAAPGAGGH